MGDISHSFGQDIDLSAGGDFLYVADETQQHVIKRLLTAAGSDLWAQSYGAGLGQFVGRPLNLTSITNAVLSQIYQETSVAQLPAPVVTATQQNTSVVVEITYTDGNTGQTQALTFPLGS
jgi:phage baseplate assembly protein W